MTPIPRLARVPREAARRARRDASALRLALGLTTEIEPYLAEMLASDAEGVTAIPKAVFGPNAEALVKAGALEPMMVGRQPSGRFDVARMRSVARAYRAMRHIGREGATHAG